MSWSNLVRRRAILFPISSLEEMVKYEAEFAEIPPTAVGGSFRSFLFEKLCPKSLNGALLCAASVFSVSLWLMNSEQKHTTETQRTQRLHREVSEPGLLRQSHLKTISAGLNPAHGSGRIVQVHTIYQQRRIWDK